MFEINYNEIDSNNEINKNKIGVYKNPEKGCPNCGRFRVMLGNDKKCRCEKCAWCIEDNDFDYVFLDYLNK